VTALNELTIRQAHNGLVKKEFTCLELARACLARIDGTNDDFNAFLEVFADEASEQARRVDAKIIIGGEVGPLEGIPLAVKDNILIRGKRSSSASKILEGYVAPYDAFVIAKLRAAGAVFLGRTNMDEFAMGSSTENSAYGPTKNPWNPKLVPGGSSGGSAAAVAADMCLAALGSDTGGSVRQPAALCGVVGLKPTYGSVSRNGLMAMASSLDQIGSLTKTAADARIVFKAIAGGDHWDSTAVPDRHNREKTDVKGLRVGVPKEFFIEGMDAEVEKAVREGISRLGEMGATIKEVSLPHSDFALAVYYILMAAEVSSNLARFDGVRYGRREAGDILREVYGRTRAAGFGAEVRRRIMLGTHVLSTGYYDAYYKKAQQARTLVRNDFSRVFEEVDLLAAPTTPTVAWPIGEKFEDPLTMYLSDIYTVSANVAGIPAVSVPCGFKDGLPIGLHLLGRPFGEETILSVAESYEQVSDWLKEKPAL